MSFHSNIYRYNSRFSRDNFSRTKTGTLIAAHSRGKLKKKSSPENLYFGEREVIEDI